MNIDILKEALGCIIKARLLLNHNEVVYDKNALEELELRLLNICYEEDIKNIKAFESEGRP